MYFSTYITHDVQLQNAIWFNQTISIQEGSSPIMNLTADDFNKDVLFAEGHFFIRSECTIYLRAEL